MGCPSTSRGGPRAVTSKNSRPSRLYRSATDHSVRVRIAAVLFLSAACAASASCSKTLDFSGLENADRIDVRTPSDVRVKEIVDPAQIRIATTFIESHAAGWSESPAGPLVPDVMLYFFRGSSRLGGYGIADTHIVADPTTHGWLSRTVTRAENDTLLRQLGIELPVRSPKGPSH